jgi:conjugative transposon TraN protein
MKRFVCLVCVCLIFVSSFAQTPSLCLSTEKTTSLIFPFAIRHVDRGSVQILVQVVKEAENILLVKAAGKNISETNLSVVTEDGSLYSFLVCYDGNPLTWVYKLPTQSSTSVSEHANNLLDNPPILRGINDRSWGLFARVSGMYIKGDVLYCQIEVVNNSSIDYDIESLRFYIRDKKKAKRTAVQETELKPLCMAGNAHSKTVFVAALDKFTIPDAKLFAIELLEESGGRHLFMKMANKHLVRAKPLPDLR